MSDVRIDHVVVTVRDLDRAATRLLEDHGLGSVAGGAHPSWGTANRIVPAGAAYVELMGIGDREVAEGTDLGRFVLDRSAGGDRPALACLRPDDLDATCARLGLVAEERSRVLPDGATLTWRMAGLARALAEGAPFFIAWGERTGADVPDPGTGERGQGLSRVDLGGDPEAVAAYVGGEVPGLRLVGGEPGVHAVVVETVAGESVTLA